MKKWKELYLQDLFRYGKDKPKRRIRRLLKEFRKCQNTKNKLSYLLHKLSFDRIKFSLNIELFPECKIDGGLYVGHPYGITINPETIIGKNCNIHKGVTIGQENRGSRKGSPTIGDDVWIGINSTIVGKVNIGNDVLIAPNTFVNCDIPSHSVVFGNPCIIKHKDKATKDYINNRVL